LADCNAALQEETTDLIDHSRPLADQARPYAVECLQVQLIVSLYWNAARRWPLHSFSDRVCISEVVFVTLAEGLGISRRYLSHIMTERKQLASNIVRRHASLDPDQARLHIRKPGTNPAASSRKTIIPCSSKPIKCNVCLPVSMPMVLAATALVVRDIARAPRVLRSPIQL
jgi:hypothetical protein